MGNIRRSHLKERKKEGRKEGRKEEKEKERKKERRKRKKERKKTIQYFLGIQLQFICLKVRQLQTVKAESCLTKPFPPVNKFPSCHMF
jgi:hypothetical protein